MNKGFVAPAILVAMVVMGVVAAGLTLSVRYIGERQQTTSQAEFPETCQGLEVGVCSTTPGCNWNECLDCRFLSENECVSNSGCAWNSYSCSGLSEGVCNAAEGCYWQEAQVAPCLLNPGGTGCNYGEEFCDYTPPSGGSCTGTFGSGSCGGASGCNTFDNQPECQINGCTWTQTQQSCANFQTQFSCQNQEGCSWVGGTPASCSGTHEIYPAMCVGGSYNRCDNANQCAGHTESYCSGTPIIPSCESQPNHQCTSESLCNANGGMITDGSCSSGVCCDWGSVPPTPTTTPGPSPTPPMGNQNACRYCENNICMVNQGSCIPELNECTSNSECLPPSPTPSPSGEPVVSPTPEGFCYDGNPVGYLSCGGFREAVICSAPGQNGNPNYFPAYMPYQVCEGEAVCIVGVGCVGGEVTPTPTLTLTPSPQAMPTTSSTCNSVPNHTCSSEALCLVNGGSIDNRYACSGQVCCDYGDQPSPTSKPGMTTCISQGFTTCNRAQFICSSSAEMSMYSTANELCCAAGCALKPSPVPTMVISPTPNMQNVISPTSVPASTSCEAAGYSCANASLCAAEGEIESDYVCSGFQVCCKFDTKVFQSPIISENESTTNNSCSYCVNEDTPSAMCITRTSACIPDAKLNNCESRADCGYIPPSEYSCVDNGGVCVPDGEACSKLGVGVCGLGRYCCSDPNLPETPIGGSYYPEDFGILTCFTNNDCKQPGYTNCVYGSPIDEFGYCSVPKASEYTGGGCDYILSDGTVVCTDPDNLRLLPEGICVDFNRYIDPSMIVVHWDGNQSNRVEDLNTKVTYNGLVGNNTSVHFGVGVDGVSQYLLMTEDQAQYSCGAQGYFEEAINIEVAGWNFDVTPPPPEVYDELVNLVQSLMDQYDIPQDRVYGHFEVSQSGKPDPGPAFMQTLRSDL